MADHPPLDRILDRVLGHADAGTRDLTAHLVDCESCRAAEKWARGLVEAAAEGPPSPAPTPLVDRALGIEREVPRTRRAARGWSIVTRIEHAIGRPALAGIRGAPTARRILFEIDEGHLDVEIAPSPEDGEHLKVTGQFMFDDRPPPHDLLALLWLGQKVIARAAGDVAGVFVLPRVPPGVYRLELLSLSVECAIRIAEIAVRMEEP